MKEKTFEELIEESPLHELLSEPEKDMVKDLMQQVREATIAECIKQVLTSDKMIDKMYGLSHLKLDRIRIEP